VSRVRTREVAPPVDLPTIAPAVEPEEPPKQSPKRKPASTTEPEEESS
jgi:hypothetical protein